MAASKAAQKRLSKEYMLMQKEPPPFVWAVPEEKNILTWNYIIRGPPDSPFAGGEYHGVLLFPPEYPFKPPGIKMLTPSGRFQPDRKICFSMSDFHPGSWNPAWSVATILTGLLSFMLSDEITTGAIKASDQMKRHYAEKSHTWNLAQARFKEAFPDFCDPIMKDLPNMAGTRPSSSSTPTPDVPEPFSRATQLPIPISVTTSATSTGGTTTPSSLSTSTDALLQQPGVGLAPGSAQAGKEGEVVVVENWINSALRLLWEKWRWGLLIAVAVFVSRATSSK